MGKYKPNPQYDQDFADAMRLKLRLNREARAKAAENTPPASAPPAESVSDRISAPGFRDGLIDSILEETPGLTREELEPMMRAMGF
jgi:hypothetical protein